MQHYRLSHWQYIRQRSGEIDPGFAQRLRHSARPRQIAFQRLMAMTEGNPAYLECKSATREAWAFVLPDLNGEGSWRIQHFDPDGFTGHTCHNSVTEATEALIGEGYRVPDPGALDRCSATVRWAVGVKRAELRLQVNHGKTGWAEMAGRLQDIGGAVFGGEFSS